MTKAEFLEALEQKLAEEMDAESVRRNLRYYESYIDSAIRDGRSEQAVLEELGSPLLIARTIVDTREDTYGDSERASYGGQSVYRDRSYGNGEETDHDSVHGNLENKRNKVIIILVIIAILILVFTVLRILLPVLLPIALILFVVSLFKNR